MTVELIPPDLEQCQAEHWNKYTFMTLGGKPGLVRCEEKAEFIITEKEINPADGQRGSQSVCSKCLARAHNLLGDMFIVEPIEKK